MSYCATVVDVAIAAAPGTDDARAVIESVLHSWSASRAPASGIVLVPKRLPASAPSERIRLIDNADVLIALTAGPETDTATSAAVTRACVLGRPVHVYRPARIRPVEDEPREDEPWTGAPPGVAGGQTALLAGHDTSERPQAIDSAAGESEQVVAVEYANGGELYRRLWHAMERDALAVTRTSDDVDPVWDAQFPDEHDGTLVHREAGLDDFGALLMDDKFAAAVADRILTNLYSDYWYAASPQAKQAAIMQIRRDPAAAMLLALRAPIPLQWQDVRLARADGRFLG